MVLWRLKLKLKHIRIEEVKGGEVKVKEKAVIWIRYLHVYGWQLKAL